MLAIVGLACLLHWALIRAGIPRLPAGMVAVLICSMPAIQVYAAWAILTPDTFALLLAGGASVVLVAALDARDFVFDRFAGSCVMLVAAVFIFQPAAMMFWVFLAIGLVGARHDAIRGLRAVKTHFGVGAVALIVSYLVTKLLDHLLRSEPGADRAAIAHDVIGKARWFVREPLFQALNLFRLTSDLGFAIAVGGVGLVGITLWLWTRSDRPLLYFGVGVVLIPLTYFPNLVEPNDYPPFRTQVALTSIIALYLGLGVLGGGVVIRDWLRPRVTRRRLRALTAVLCVASVAFVSVSAFMAAKNTLTLIVEPQMTELQLLRAAVAAVPTFTPNIEFVLTAPNGGIVNDVPNDDEFGWPTSADPWTPIPEIDLILRAEGRLSPSWTPSITLFSPGTTLAHTGEPVIDLGPQLLGLR